MYFHILSQRSIYTLPDSPHDYFWLPCSTHEGPNMWDIWGDELYRAW
jgi:hypothetical protein